jgi:hypothetical protein
LLLEGLAKIGLKREQLDLQFAVNELNTEERVSSTVVHCRVHSSYSKLGYMHQFLKYFVKLLDV